MDINSLAIIPDEPENSYSPIRSANGGREQLYAMFDARDLAGVEFYLRRMSDLGFAKEAAGALAYKLADDDRQPRKANWHNAMWSDGPQAGPTFGLQVLKKARAVPGLADEFQHQDWGSTLHRLARTQQWGVMAQLANDGVKPSQRTVRDCLAAGRMQVLEKFADKHPDELRHHCEAPAVLQSARSEAAVEFVLDQRGPKAPANKLDVFGCLQEGNVAAARILVEQFGAPFPRNEVTNNPNDVVPAWGARSPEDVAFIKGHFVPAVSGYVERGLGHVACVELLDAWLDAKSPKVDVMQRMGQYQEELASDANGEALLRALKDRLGVNQGTVHLRFRTAHQPDPETGKHAQEFKLKPGDVAQIKVYGPERACPGFGLADWLAAQTEPEVALFQEEFAKHGLEVKREDFNLAKSLLALGGSGEVDREGRPLAAFVSTNGLAATRFTDKTDDGFTAAEVLLVSGASAAMFAAPGTEQETRAAHLKALRPQIAGKPLLEWIASGGPRPQHHKRHLQAQSASLLGWTKVLPPALLNPEYVTREGKTLVELAFESLAQGGARATAWGFTGLTENDASPEMERLLNVTNSRGDTALHLLARIDPNTMARNEAHVLVALGADPLAKNNEGKTAADIAVEEAARTGASRHRIEGFIEQEKIARKARGFDGDIVPEVVGMSSSGNTFQARYMLEREGKPALDVTAVVAEVANAKRDVVGEFPARNHVCVLRTVQPAAPADADPHTVRELHTKHAAQAAAKVVDNLDKERRQRIGKGIAELDAREARQAKLQAQQNR